MNLSLFLTVGKGNCHSSGWFFAKGHILQSMQIKVVAIKNYKKGLVILLFLVSSNFLTGQTVRDPLPSKVTLSQCLSYALANQAQIKQALLDEEIARKDIGIALSGWYPQLEIDGNLQHYLRLPATNYPNLGNPPQFTPWVTIPSTINNSSTGIFYASQALFNSTLYFAARNSGEYRIQASQNTLSSKINTYVDVNKAFFDVLITEEQLHVLDEDIHRLERNYQDAFALYQSGITDKIDYQRTQIALSNIRAQRKSTEEALKSKYAFLKQLMGVVPEEQLTVSYDSARFENEILFDTTKNLDYNNRIEYQLFQTRMRLQHSQVGYYNWSFLPTLSAFYENSPSFQSGQFSDLYNKASRTTFLGLKFSLPLFQGMNRIENLKKAKLQYQRLQFGMDYMKSVINTEYTQALALYTGNLNELKVARENVTLATNIFNTVKLQYTKGVKAYLEVIVSETDLRSAELNYLNLLFKVLTSKMDLERALGMIKPE